MERKKVYLGDAANALEFIQKATGTLATMQLNSGNQTVNAKSILGVFSLDLTQPVFLEIIGDQGSIQEAFLAVKEYILI